MTPATGLGKLAASCEAACVTNWSISASTGGAGAELPNFHSIHLNKYTRGEMHRVA
jgi:F0F1-type ATP synthase assembly protein I